MCLDIHSDSSLSGPEQSRCWLVQRQKSFRSVHVGIKGTSYQERCMQKGKGALREAEPGASAIGYANRLSLPVYCRSLLAQSLPISGGPSVNLLLGRLAGSLVSMDCRHLFLKQPLATHKQHFTCQFGFADNPVATANR